jgi:hypothetical protein
MRIPVARARQQAFRPLTAGYDPSPNGSRERVGGRGGGGRVS